jgi:hypothetical protein
MPEQATQMEMDDEVVQFERWAQLIDKLDNLSAALMLPTKDSLHVRALRESLPNIIAEFKDVYVKIAGADPWDL